MLLQENIVGFKRGERGESLCVLSNIFKEGSLIKYTRTNYTHTLYFFDGVYIFKNNLIPVMYTFVYILKKVR